MERSVPLANGNERDMMRKSMKKNGGFTLVELVIVVAILGTLVAILSPVYTKMKGKADIRTCHANQETAVREYLTEIADNPSMTQEEREALVSKYHCTTKGTYAFTCGEDSLSVECSLHGKIGGDGSGTGENPPKKTLQEVVNDFLNGAEDFFGGAVNVDSTNPNEDSRTGKIKEKLDNTDDKIWAISYDKNKNQVTYYIADTAKNSQIDGKGAGSWIAITKTNPDGTTEKGYCKITIHADGYRIINKGTFKPQLSPSDKFIE